MKNNKTSTATNSSFFSRQGENFLVGLITNLISPAIMTLILLCFSQSDWFAVKFLDKKMPIECTSKLESNKNLWLYEVKLKIPHQNRQDLRSVYMISTRDSFYIEPNSLITPETFSLGKYLGVEDSGAFYGARLVVQKTLDLNSSSEISLKIRSNELLKEGTCDFFAFSEY